MHRQVEHVWSEMSLTSHCASGIGKGVFLSFLMWQLASSKTTIVWESRDAGAVVKLSPLGVWEGPLAAFREDLDDPMTW